MININNLVKKGQEYLMDAEFQRIRNGERIGLNKQPYPIKLYDNLIRFYENEEQYEKCSEILKQKNTILDHNSNYTWTKN
jgi:hypothetical protein